MVEGSGSTAGHLLGEVGMKSERHSRGPRLALVAAAVSGAVRALVGKLLDVFWPLS